MCRRRRYSLFFILVFVFCGLCSHARAYEIGVFYFPGWNSTSKYWNDIKGLPGSRSPGVSWPDRVPLLGYYPEEESWVAEKHIEQASLYGINFFAYDWYWFGKNSESEHALQSFLRAKNKDKMKFCLLWANHNAVPSTMQEYDDMLTYWLDHYFNQPNYYRLNNKPVIFLFSYDWLASNAVKFGETVKSLLARAHAKVQERGYPGIYFVLTTNERPSDNLEQRLIGYGFDAYTAWNYVVSKDGSRVADYNSMVDTYLDFYNAAAKTARSLPYIVPASPGFDDRPWLGTQATVRTDSTPEKFSRMLTGAKILLDDPKTTHKILMIEAWNEFAEGATIEPTKKWGFKYLEVIKKMSTSPTPTAR